MNVNAIFPTNADLFTPPEEWAEIVKPWKPHALSHDEWPGRDYRSVYAWRIATLAQLQGNPELVKSAKAYYAGKPAEFIMHWMDTYDPRKSPTHTRPELRGPKRMPFVFFNKQVDVIDFLHEMRETGENGLVEKCRDAGVTWLACAYSVWSWLFIPGDAIGWGSRKQELVDKIGDMSSIFEKLRMLIRGLPSVFKPEGLKERDHLKSMNIVNPENGSAITGEIGDNIGRGGRTSMYFKDESAHYERPEKIQASLDDNTHVQIDISSVNGLGNVFHRRREAGEEWHRYHHIAPGTIRVLVIDWSDHPEKTQAWFDRRKAAAEREGLYHNFAQEVLRDYSAAMQNRIIPAEWIRAAVDAHMVVPCLHIPPPAMRMAGLDVADDGDDKNALAVRQWVILRSVESWGERDPGVTARKAIDRLKPFKGIKCQYDSIGVGASVKAEYNRLVFDEKLISERDCQFVPWNAGAAVVDQNEHIIPGDEESATNGDFFQNMKAQAWWALRTRFYKTFKAVTEGAAYPADDLISLDSSIPVLHDLMKELAQPTSKPSASLKTMIDKKPEGTKSPNLADAVVMAYFPAPEETNFAVVGKQR